MERHERDHLSDLEIAILVSGQGSRALHQALCEHLVGCTDCRELLAQTVVAGRSEMQGPDAQGGLATVPADSMLHEQMLHALARIVPPTAASPARRLSVQLHLLTSAAEDEGLALAARASAPSQLPTLASDDGSIIVHFRRPRPEAPLRAYVVRKAPAAPGTLWLVFPEVDAFRIGPEGEADLQGVTEARLGEGRVQIELRPMGGPGD